LAIASNKNTTQQPMSTAGRTGIQSIKYIPAPRVYVRAADSITAAPVQTYFTKSNGATPTGWTDLGSVMGAAKLTYTAKVKEVNTGIDNYLRAAYIDQKTGNIEFDLSQLDDVTLETVSGLTASVITAGSVINYQVGQLDLNQMAILLVVQNKLDGKEWQFYNPNAYLNFSFAESGDSLVLKTTGLLPFFTALGQTKEGMISSTVFA
jgi:hypothetical protein